MTELAFPNAVGWGRYTQGGRGGRVYHITTLADAVPAPPGSLRECIIASGPRIAVFDVGGTIEVVKQMTIEDPYLTIAGQTAPGGGICLKNSPENMDSPLSWRTHDIIISNIRSRPGIGGTSIDGDRQGDSVDAFGNTVGDVYNLYLRHCSGSWSVDEICDLYGAHDVTIEGCLFAEPLNLATHSYTAEDPNIGHAKHMLASDTGSANISVIRTTFSKGMDRHPEAALAGGYFDMVNCVLSNWGTELAPRGGRQWVTLLSDRTGNFSANLIANYYRRGSMSDDRERIYYSHPDGSLGDRLTVCLSANEDSNLGLLETIYSGDPDHSTLMVVDFALGDAAWGTVLSAQQAYTWATGALGAGASYRLDDNGMRVDARDRVDARVLLEMQDNRGSLINDPSEVGGWPPLEMGTPLDWLVPSSVGTGLSDSEGNENDPSDVRTCVPKAFAEQHPGATLESFLWQ